MLYLTDIPLPAKSATLLRTYQTKVDAEPTFAQRVQKGKALFSNYNKNDNPAFSHVRSHLARMSGGTVRCNYCEDSNANQVEHIYPKNFYPEKCFEWLNYCYACGPCNQPKSDKFAIYALPSGNELDLKTLPKDTQPPAGEALLIDPRHEDPTELLFLDIAYTFKFTPLADTPREFRRAEYTIRLLGLNSRSFLVRARKNAFSSFQSGLFEYVHKKEAQAPQSELDRLRDVQQQHHHQTVWFEMKRQRTQFAELNDLFNRAPEALTW